MDHEFGFQVVLNQCTIPVYYLSHIPKTQIQSLKVTKKFVDYMKSIDNAPQDVKVQKVIVHCILMFSDRIGYVTLKVNMYKGQKDISNFVFLRGGSVSILLFANSKLVVVEQYRVPAQKMFIEPPAGIIDQSGDLVSKAVEQIEEQTGIKITKDMLRSMGSLIPNPQICDEEMFLFHCQIKIDPLKMAQIESKQHGQKNSQQKIRVKFIEYDPHLILSTGNCSFIALACAYEHQNRKIEARTRI